MKQRFPRKLKKRAKKLKKVNDAMVMAQAAIVATMGCSQVAMITGQPIPLDVPGHSAIALKTLAVARSTIQSAQGIQNVLKEIKTWQHFARWK